MSAISLKSITGITSITTPAGVDNQLTLHTNNTTERVRITSDGKLLVGRTSGSFALDVESASVNSFRISNSAETSHGSNDARIVAGGTYYQNPTIVGREIKFRTFNTSATEGERVRISANGKVGIGTDNPDYGLHVHGAGDILVEDSGGGSAHMRLRSANNGSDVSNWKLKTSGNNYFYIENDTVGGTSQFTINDSGDMGLAMTTPRSRLDVFEKTTGNQTAIRIGNSNTPSSANDKRLEFVDGVGTTEGTNKYTYGYIQGFRSASSNAGDLIFGTKNNNASAPTEKLRIKSDGTINITTANGNLEWTASSGSNPFIRSVGSGQQSLEFNTGGDERLRITSTGEVGINVSPASGNLLHVKNASADAIIKIESEVGYDARLKLDTSSGGGAEARIDFEEDASIRGFISYTNNAGGKTDDMIFGTATQERLRITSDGQLGLSVTPDTWSTGKGLTIGTSQATLWGAGDQINLSGNAYFNSGWKAAATKAGASQIQQALGNIDFKVSGSVTADNAITWIDAVRIGSNGSVGIGTDHLSGNNSVYHKLMVEGDTTSQIAVAKIVRKNSSASNDSYTFEVDSSSHTSNVTNGGAMSVDVNGGRAFTIDGNGSVGIQTNLPSAAFLDIASSNFTDSLRLRRISSDTNVASNWSMKPYAGYLYFREGGSTDKISFASNGNLNVLDGSVIATNTGAGSGTSNLELQPYGTQGYINFTGSSNLYLRMGSSYAQKFIFRGTGDLELSDGNLMVASGHGIDFSATGNPGSGASMANELLDDYEEGSWTPLLHGYWSSGWRQITIGSGTVEGATYTRVGRLVYFKCYFNGITMSGNGPNTFARIYGLPYQCANDGYGYGTMVTHSTAFENTNTGNFYISPNASDMISNMYGEDNAGYARWSQSSFVMMLSGVYQAA